MSAVGEVRCLNGLQLFGKTSVVVYAVFRSLGTLLSVESLEKTRGVQ